MRCLVRQRIGAVSHRSERAHTTPLDKWSRTRSYRPPNAIVAAHGSRPNDGSVAHVSPEQTTVRFELTIADMPIGARRATVCDSFGRDIGSSVRCGHRPYAGTA